MTVHPFDPSTLPVWQALLLLAPAVLAAAAACFASDRADTASVWRGARWATGAGLGLAGLGLAVVCLRSNAVGFGLRADSIGSAVMLLVTFVGWVIVRYSQPYLNGEAEERRYVRWLRWQPSASSLRQTMCCC
jgi:NAD(P)H-quinone oxidoreductase subunit 5